MGGKRYWMRGERRLTRVGRYLGAQWMLLEPGDYLQGQIYTQSVWEPYLSAWFRDQLKRGQTFVDVGANIGYHTLLAARLVGPTGRVVAIEPLFHRLLRTQVQLNHWRNVTICPVAAGERNGTVEIGVGAEWNRGQSSVLSPTRFGQTRTVSLVRLDHLLTELRMERPDLIKIDVEGYEVEVLQGAGRLLQGDRAPRLVVELTPAFLESAGHSAQALKRLLTDLGYQLFYLDFDHWPGQGDYRLTPVDPEAPETGQRDLVALAAHHLR